MSGKYKSQERREAISQPDRRLSLDSAFHSENRVSVFERKPRIYVQKIPENRTWLFFTRIKNTGEETMKILRWLDRYLEEAILVIFLILITAVMFF